MRIDRRSLLAFLGGLGVWGAMPRRVVGAPRSAPDLATLSTLIGRGVVRDDSSRLLSIFDLDAPLAYDVLLRATRSDALPDGYTPRDLVVASANGIATAGHQLVRSAIVADTRALIAAAQGEGVRLYVGSGFRSQAYQVDVFAAQTARWGDEDTANRYSARPGHSQHQLGTTVDFTSEFRSFRTGGAADWLRASAHEFGFVLPYTVAASSRTGYVDEPWHARWVGRGLAALLQSLGYQEWSDLDADDAIALARTQAGLDA